MWSLPSQSGTSAAASSPDTPTGIPSISCTTTSGSRLTTRSAAGGPVRPAAVSEAPWIVVPADHKRFTRLVVSNAIVDALEGLDLRFPTIDDARRVSDWLAVRSP